MLLHHGVADFPEAVGKTVLCGGCSKHLEASESISLVYIQPLPDGRGQVQMSLVCMECVVSKLEAQGNA